MKVAIWWIRRDLRLADNPALTAALAQTEVVIPLFILDPALWKTPSTAPTRATFLLDGLRRLDDELRQCGSSLVVRRGEPSQVLVALIAEIQPRPSSLLLFAEEDYSPYARRRDAAVRNAQILPVHLVHGLTLLHPTSVLKADGTPYTVFTPFSRAWEKRVQAQTIACLPAPSHIPSLAGISSLPLPENPSQAETLLLPAGEAHAQQRLSAFTRLPDAPIYTYAQQRDLLAEPGTSFLSPYLRFGMLSARQAYLAGMSALQFSPESSAQRSTYVWLNELIWREFYQSITYHFPEVHRTSFRRAFRAMKWNNNPQDFAAWCNAATGYPVVDAAMHQLLHSGWMHNRARMLTASFLTKDLLVDWRWGERWFMQHLLDGDPAANNGGWQWCAGTGTDAAPFFRIFNPISQGKRFDPHGNYVRRWLPQMRNVPDEYVHEPWRMPPALQHQLGCILGKDYPLPIVEHAWARQRALALWRAVP